MTSFSAEHHIQDINVAEGKLLLANFIVDKLTILLAVDFRINFIRKEKTNLLGNVSGKVSRKNITSTFNTHSICDILILDIITKILVKDKR